MFYFVTCWPNIWGKTWKRKERKSVLVFALRLPIIAKSGKTLPKIEHFWNFQICWFCLSCNWFCQLEPWGRGGDHRDKNWLFESIQVNSIVIPIYKNREKRIFEFGDRFDPPHWPSKFENHHVRVKIQNCRRPIEWPIKTCARRALSLWERFQLNRTYQLGEKSKKPPENTVFQKSSISGGFLDFSPNW